MKSEKRQFRILFGWIGMVLMMGLGCNLLVPGEQGVPAAVTVTAAKIESPQQERPTETAVPVQPTAAAPAESSPVEPTAAKAVEVTQPPAEHGKIAALEGLPPMTLSGLWAAPDGMLWSGGDQGVYRADGKIWNVISGKPVSALLGSDEAGRVWVLFEGGAAIGYYQDGGWKFFNRQSGWEPLAAPEYLSPGPASSLLTGGDGRLWLATGGGELRRFDPQDGRWAVVTAEAMGLPAPDPNYQGYFITSTAKLKDGSVLAGICAGEGESFKPVGVSRLRDGLWKIMASTEEDCVLDLETAGDGTVWAAGFNALLELCPDCETWKHIPLPAYERRQLIQSVEIDPRGDPWVEVMRYGGASAYGEAARYALKGGEWVSVYGPAPYGSTALAFGAESSYLEAGGVLYRLEGGAPQEIASLGRGEGNYRMVVDRNGLLWIARLGDSNGGLWTYLP